jgi:hypothetical protein
MTQTATQIPIDPMDARNKLTAVLDRETRFLDQVKQLSLREGRKTTICVAPLAWLLWHVSIPQSEELVFEGTPVQQHRFSRTGNQEISTSWRPAIGKGKECPLTLIKLIIAR